mgnify:FL=1
MENHKRTYSTALILILIFAAMIILIVKSKTPYEKKEVYINPFGYELKSVNLIDYKKDSSFAVSDNYIYYVGNNNTIYKADLDDTDKRKVIYEYKANTQGQGYFSGISIEKRQEHIFFSYHIGNASMGNTYEAEIFSDESISELAIVSFGVPSFSGTPDYAMDWMTTGDGAISYKAPRYETEKYDYLIAYRPVIPNDASRIYRLNKETQEMTMISDIPTMHFKYRDEKIYFVGNDRKLYCFRPGEEIIETVCAGPIDIERDENYEVLNGNIYYINSDNNKLYKNGDSEPINHGTEASFITLTGQYIKLVFEGTEDGLPLTIFLDGSGNTALENSFPVYLDSTGSDYIIYFDKETEKVMMTI